MRQALSVMLLLALVAGVAHAQAGAAAPDPATDSTTQEELFEDGWIQVAPNVFKRPHADGSIETLAYGKAGLEVVLEELQPRLAHLQARFERTNDPDLLDGIENLKRHIADTERELEIAESATNGTGAMDNLTPDDPINVGCTTNITRVADARAGSSGPEASADASFSDTCNAYGDVFAHAEAEGDLGTDFRSATNTDDPPGAFGSSSADAFAAVTADSNCYSYAYAEVKVEDDTGSLATYTQSDTNNECAPLNVNIKQTSPTTDTDNSHTIVLDCGACDGASWSAITNLPASSYSWRWDGSVVGSASTYLRLICPTQEGTHTLRVTADSGTQTDVDSVSVEVVELCFEDPTCSDGTVICTEGPE